MPGRNRTGPMGMGPMTGRGTGWCTGYAGRNVDYPAAGPGCGMGFGWGRGSGGGGRMGRGFGRGGGMRFGGYETPYGYRAYAPPDPDRERQALANHAEALQAELDWIQKRLDAIETSPSSDQ